jgi:transcriptional regulator with XRE-family HTH domain
VDTEGDGGRMAIQAPAEQVPKRPRSRRAVHRDGPDPIDVHVGAGIRRRRRILGISQDQLARRIGLTFQQIQKYERGGNRVSASALWRLAQALEVPAAYFFEGLGDAGVPTHDAKLDDEFARVAKLYRDVPTSVRGAITRLVETIGKTVRYPDG